MFATALVVVPSSRLATQTKENPRAYHGFKKMTWWLAAVVLTAASHHVIWRLVRGRFLFVLFQPLEANREACCAAAVATIAEKADIAAEFDGDVVIEWDDDLGL